MRKKMTQQDAKNWFKIHMPTVFDLMKVTQAWRECDNSSVDNINQEEPLAYLQSIQPLIKYKSVIIPQWLYPVLNKQIAAKAKTSNIWKAVREADFESLLYFVRIIGVDLISPPLPQNAEEDEDEEDYFKPLLHTLLKKELPPTVECLKFLIGHGAPVDTPDEMNLTPLHQILHKRTVNLELVEILLENKAQVNTVSLNHHSLFEPVLKNDRPDIIHLLLGKTRCLPNDGSTLLCWAAAGGKAPIIEYITVCKTLIESFGVSINAKDALGNTPLITAIANKKDEIAFVLLEDYKPNVHLINKNGESALSLLATRHAEHPDPLPLAEALIRKGADPQAKHNSLSCPLDLATIHKNEKLIKLFNDLAAAHKNTPPAGARVLARTKSPNLLSHSPIHISAIPPQTPPNSPSQISTTPPSTPPRSPVHPFPVTWHWPITSEPLKLPKFNLYDDSSSDSYGSEEYDSASSQQNHRSKKFNSGCVSGVKK